MTTRLTDRRFLTLAALALLCAARARGAEDRPAWPVQPLQWFQTGERVKVDEDLLSVPVRLIRCNLCLVRNGAQWCDSFLIASDGTSEGQTIRGEIRFSTLEGAKWVQFRYDYTPSFKSDGSFSIKMNFESGGKLTVLDLQLKNWETATLDFMEEEPSRVRYGLSITPSLRLVEPAPEFYGRADSLALGEGAVFMDGRLVATAAGLYASGGQVCFGILVPGKGGFVASFKPFPGAMPCGTVREGIMTFRAGGAVVRWVSSTPFLPEGRWRVYARHVPAPVRPEGACVRIAAGEKPWEAVLGE